MRRRGFLRNFIFGAEDGLVSTVGLLSGVSFAGLGRKEIIISGIILILVEALSMGAGVYISEDSSNDMTEKDQRDDQLGDSVVMFFSYALIGLLPLLSYLFIVDTRQAFYYSIATTIIALISLGVFRSIYTKKPMLSSVIKTTAIGTVVVLIAVAVGSLVRL